MRGSASSPVRFLAGIFFSLILVSCGAPASPPSTSPPATDAPAPATSGTASPRVTETSAAAWRTFTTTDGDLAFDLPAAWTIKDPAGEVPEGGGVFVEVLNPAGKSMATLRTNMATGSTCTERYPYSVLDTQAMTALAQSGQTPRYVFESRTDAAAKHPRLMNIVAYGIATGPAPTGDTACPIFHFFTWPPTAAMFAGTCNPFDTTPGNEPHVDTPEAYLQTIEYKDIRKMITSLRPA